MKNTFEKEARKAIAYARISMVLAVISVFLAGLVLVGTFSEWWPK